MTAVEASSEQAKTYLKDITDLGDNIIQGDHSSSEDLIRKIVRGESGQPALVIFTEITRHYTFWERLALDLAQHYLSGIENSYRGGREWLIDFDDSHVKIFFQRLAQMVNGLARPGYTHEYSTALLNTIAETNETYRSLIAWADSVVD